MASPCVACPSLRTTMRREASAGNMESAVCIALAMSVPVVRGMAAKDSISPTGLKSVSGTALSPKSSAAHSSSGCLAAMASRMNSSCRSSVALPILSEASTRKTTARRSTACTFCRPASARISKTMIRVRSSRLLISRRRRKAWRGKPMNHMSGNTRSRISAIWGAVSCIGFSVRLSGLPSRAGPGAIDGC